MNTEETTKDASAIYLMIAEQLELAAQHSRIAARHMENHEVPRACAHALATIGHIGNAQDSLDKATRLHAAKSLIE